MSRSKKVKRTSNQEEIRNALRTLRNISEQDRDTLKNQAMSVYFASFTSITEKARTEKRRSLSLRPSSSETRRLHEDTNVIKSKDKTKRPYAFLFEPVALFVTKPIKKGQYHQICLRIGIGPTLEINPLGDSEIFHVYTHPQGMKGRYFQFVAKSPEVRDSWVQRLQNCRDVAASKGLVRSASSVLQEDEINGIRITEYQDGVYEIMGFCFDETFMEGKNVVFDRERQLEQCTLEKLIEHISAPVTLSRQRDRLDCFLMTYKLLITPRLLLRLLLARISRVKFKEGEEGPRIRAQIAHIFLEWIRQYPEDLSIQSTLMDGEPGSPRESISSSSSGIQKDLEAFLDEVATVGRMTVSRNELLHQIYQASSPSLMTPPSSPIHTPRRRRAVSHTSGLSSSAPDRLQVNWFWLDARALDIAKYLALRGKKLHQCVTARCFLFPTANRNLLRMRKERELFSQLVYGSLDAVAGEAQAIHLLTHLVDILHHCLHFHNYLYAYAIYRALAARDATEFEQLSEPTMAKWKATFAVFNSFQYYVLYRENHLSGQPFVPAIELDCEWLQEQFEFQRHQTSEGGLIHWKSLYEFGCLVSKLVSKISYTFQVNTEARCVVQSLLSESSLHLPLPEIIPLRAVPRTGQHLLPLKSTPSEVRESEITLERLRSTSLLADFLATEDDQEFFTAISKLTREHLNEFIHIDQWSLVSQSLLSLSVDVKWPNGTETTSLVVGLSGDCDQFQVYTCTVQLTNESAAPLSFKILHRQEGPLSVRFIPWNGTIPPNSYMSVVCKFVVRYNGLHRVPVRLILSNKMSLCLVVQARGRPFSKLREVASPPSDRVFLGKGGSGAVYQVRLPMSAEMEDMLGFSPAREERDLPAAEKQFSGLEDLEGRQLDEFRRELMVLSGVEHENIIQGLAFCRNPPTIYMELATNGDLAALIERGPIEPSIAQEILLGCARALEYLHDLGYVHRDVKPANILLHQIPSTDRFIPKLCDFGGTSFTFASNQTRSAHGTIRFEAPEVIEQYEKKNPSYQFSSASDVFAFGMVMYCVIAGTCTPMEAIGAHDVGSAILKGERPPLPCVSQRWQDLISHCWHQEPRQRPTFTQIVEKLEGLPAPKLEV